MPSPVVLSALAGISSLTSLELDFSAVKTPEPRAPGATLGGKFGLPYLARDPDPLSAKSRLLPDSPEEVELGLTTNNGLQELLRLANLHSLAFQRAAHLTGWQLLLLEGVCGGPAGLTSLQLRYCLTANATEDLRDASRSAAEQMVNGLCDIMEVHAAHCAVAELTGLQELRLAGGFEPDWSALDDGGSGNMWNKEWREECLDGMQMLMHAVGRLPQPEFGVEKLTAAE
ncbi:hypothetical protein COO60DRAFT_1641032 [Scenedesmus sp. NREL 46B-D3]|nr:hypothetical protein COO60DRAFT_1641032 [Scenedesmus sp. NREL 46B-D3]